MKRSVFLAARPCLRGALPNPSGTTPRAGVASFVGSSQTQAHATSSKRTAAASALAPTAISPACIAARVSSTACFTSSRSFVSSSSSSSSSAGASKREGEEDEEGEVAMVDGIPPHAYTVDPFVIEGEEELDGPAPPAAAAAAAAAVAAAAAKTAIPASLDARRAALAAALAGAAPTAGSANGQGKNNLFVGLDSVSKGRFNADNNDDDHDADGRGLRSLDDMSSELAAAAARGDLSLAGAGVTVFEQRSATNPTLRIRVVARPSTPTEDDDNFADDDHDTSAATAPSVSSLLRRSTSGAAAPQSRAKAAPLTAHDVLSAPHTLEFQSVYDGGDDAHPYPLPYTHAVVDVPTVTLPSATGEGSTATVSASPAVLLPSSCLLLSGLVFTHAPLASILLLGCSHGGSLPAFIAAHYPHAVTDSVDADLVARDAARLLAGRAWPSVDASPEHPVQSAFEGCSPSRVRAGVGLLRKSIGWSACASAHSPSSPHGSASSASSSAAAAAGSEGCDSEPNATAVDGSSLYISPLSSGVRAYSRLCTPASFLSSLLPSPEAAVAATAHALAAEDAAAEQHHDSAATAVAAGAAAAAYDLNAGQGSSGATVHTNDNSSASASGHGLPDADIVGPAPAQVAHMGPALSDSSSSSSAGDSDSSLLIAAPTAALPCKQYHVIVQDTIADPSLTAPDNLRLIKTALAPGGVYLRRVPLLPHSGRAEAFDGAPDVADLPQFASEDCEHPARVAAALADVFGWVYWGQASADAVVIAAGDGPLFSDGKPHPATDERLVDRAVQWWENGALPTEVFEAVDRFRAFEGTDVMEQQLVYDPDMFEAVE